VNWEAFFELIVFVVAVLGYLLLVVITGAAWISEQFRGNLLLLFLYLFCSVVLPVAVFEGLTS